MEEIVGLFKSKAERRLDREIEARRGLNLIRRNIRDLERNEKSYIDKAKRALQMGSADQSQFLKRTIKRTMAQKRAMERQLLNIETALQIKNQAEAHAQFARSMQAVSRSIADMFDATNLNQTQRDFEKAMLKAESLEQQMDTFLDMTASSMLGYEGNGEELITDGEIDRLLADEVLEEESASELDRTIASGLRDVRAELGKE